MNNITKTTTIALMACSMNLSAQTVIKGTVSNSATGEHFAGARITLAGTHQAAMSEEDGKFELKVDHLGGVLSVEAPGYDTQLVPVQGKNTFTIKMAPKMKAEPMYNRYSLKANSATISTLFADASASIDQDIENRLNGTLRSIQHSGLDAGGATVYLRGLHSINMASQPLYIVDGVIWQSQEGFVSLHEGYFSNPLALLSPDDIESVEILKDGTAIWGAKAANGVIVIKTKRSYNMATEITVNISAGIKSKLKSVPMMDASDYRIYATDVMGGIDKQSALGGRLSTLHFLDDDKSSSFYRASHGNTNWMNEINSTAMTQNYGVSVRGGDNIALYSFSLGYSKNDGNIDNTSFDRLNVRFNSDIDLTKRLKTRADIGFSQVTRDIFDDGINEYTSPTYLALSKSPLYSAHQFDASGNAYSRLSDKDELGNGNPVAITENADGRTKNYRFTALLAPAYSFSDRLSVAALAGFAWDKIKENTFTPDFGLAERQLYNAQGEWYGEGNNSVATLMTRHSMLTLDLHAHWKAIATQQAKLSLEGGYRYTGDTFESNYGMGYNTGSDNLKSLSVTSSALRTTDGVKDDWRTISWYAQADYNYLNRYLLNIAASLESNSRYGRKAGNAISLGGIAWGLFPSVTAAWIVSNERWMSSIKAIDYLKLHAGYELTGNDDLPADATRTYFQTVGYAGLAKGLALANIGNDRLKWERTGTFTAGIDMRLLQNRLSISFDYYLSNTSDLLVRKQLREEYGLKNYWTNDGKMTNRGFEATVSSRIIDTKDWRLNAHIMAGHYKNKVKALPDGQYTTSVLGATLLTAEGNPLGLFYGYRTNGILTTQAEAGEAGLSIVDETGKKIAFGAGDVRFVDTDGNNIINEADRQIIGDPNPDIYGNFGLTLQWKRFTFDALFTYSAGNDAYNALRAQLESGSSLNNQSKNMAARWTADGQQTDVPRATYNDPMGNARFSDRWIEDASYLKLKQLSLSYQLPVKPKAIQGMSVWASVSNVFTVTRYLGTDPEFSYGPATLYQGIDAGLIPSARTYNLGIKLNL